MMNYICIGKIVNTHGIKGEVRLLSNFKYKNKVFKKGMLIYIGKNKEKEVIFSYRPHKQFDMITMEGYININQVLKYKGMKVYINKEYLILKEDEYLDEDLIGLDVMINNKVVGVVKNIEKYPQQNLILVKNSKKEFLIPYVSDIIEEINFEKRYISIQDIKGLV